MVVLARKLGSAEFCLFRVLAVISTLSIILFQPGLREALVQRKDLNAGQESTCWWISLVLGIGGGGLLFALAPVIARVMAMPPLIFGVRLICIPLFLDCLSVNAIARLQRKLRFGFLASAEVAAVPAFLIVALGLLYPKFAVWSLVDGLAMRVATRAVILLVAAPRPPRARPSGDAISDLHRFAATAWSGNLINAV